MLQVYNGLQKGLLKFLAYRISVHSHRIQRGQDKEGLGFEADLIFGFLEIAKISLEYFLKLCIGNLF